MENVVLDREKYDELVITIQKLKDGYTTFEDIKFKNYLLNKQLEECCKTFEDTYDLLSTEDKETIQKKHKNIATLIEHSSPKGYISPYLSPCTQNTNQNMVGWNLFENVVQENIAIKSELNDHKEAGPSRSHKKIKELQKEKDDLQNEKDDLQKEKDALRKEKDDLQKEKDALRKEKDDALTQIEEKNIEIKNIEGCTNDVIKELNDCQDRNNILNIELQKNRKEISQLRRNGINS